MSKKPVIRAVRVPIWEHQPQGLYWIPRRAELARDIVATNAALTLHRWRFFDPNNTSFDSCTLLGTGDETGSTGNADITVSDSGGQDPAVGFRIQIEETGGKNWSAALTIEYNHNTTGWVTTDTWDNSAQTDPHATDECGMTEATDNTYWSSSDGTDITTLGSTSQQLAGTPGGTWENGSVTQQASAPTTSITKSSHSEYGYVFVIDWAGVSNNDTIDIRVTGADTTNPVSSRITISKTGQDELGAASLSATATIPNVPASVAHSAGTTTLAGTATLAAVGQVDHVAAASITGTATVVAAGGLVVEGAASITGTATIVALASVTSPWAGVSFMAFQHPVTAGVTHEGVASITGTATLVAAGGLDITRTATLSATATLAATATVEHAAASSLTATATTVAAGRRDLGAQISITGTATVVAASRMVYSASTSLNVTASVNVVETVEHAAQTSLSGIMTVVTNETVDHSAISSLLGTATAGGLARVDHGAQIALTGDATLAVSARMDYGAIVSLTGTATLVAAGTIVGAQFGAASLSATATLAAVAAVDHEGSASITGTATLAAVGRRDRYASSAITATGTLAVSAVVTYGASVTLAATATLAAVGQVEHSASAALIGTATLNATGLPVVFLRPISVISIGDWTNELGQTTNLWESIDEGAPGNPADWIMSGTLPDTIEFLLDTISDPETAVYHTVQYGFYRDSDLPGIALDLDVQIRQGASTVIASWTNDLLPTAETFYSRTLSAAEANAITDYTDLRIRFTVREA